MKMRIVSVSLVFCFSLFAIMLGCGQQTTTTTTVTIASAQVDAAKTGVLLASGGASVGTSATGVGSSTGATILSVKAFAGPPSSFFTSLLTGTASLDGYLPATSESIGGNMAPYMRLKTAGGSVVNGAFLANKKIGKWLTLEVEGLMSAGEGNMPPNMTAEVISYVSRYVTAYKSTGDPFSEPTLFRAVSSEADYMAWAFMYSSASMETGMSSMAQMYNPGAPAHVYMVTPEATANDKIGAMEMKMVFSKTATGEIVLSVSTEPGGKPIAGTYSGTGSIKVPSGTMEATLQMNFSTDGPPSWLKIYGTTEATPKYTVMVRMCPTTMTATGEIFDSTGTRIGTLEGTPAGGRVYIGASTEAFTF